VSGADARLLAGIRRRQRGSIMAGVALVLLGGAYALWGISRFDPAVDPREDPGFDRPVAQLAFLFDGKDRALGTIQPQTSNEAFLVAELQHQLRLSSSLTILLLRLFLGTFVLTAGLILLTVVVERRRLVGVILRLQAAGGG
jgi:hypothetical protein